MLLTAGSPRPLPADWPLAQFSHTGRVAPYRWHVLHAGTEGPNVLFLHGAGASSHSWHGLFPAMAQDHRAMAVDLPGHFLTRSYTRGRLNLKSMADDLAGLLESVGFAPDMIIGHSAGAALAIGLAARLPMAPKRMVLLNGALEAFGGPAALLFPAMARGLALNPFVGPILSQMAHRIETVDQILHSTGSNLDQKHVEWYRHLLRHRTHIEGVLGMMASWAPGEIQGVMAQTPCPVLLIHGANDKAVPPAVSLRAAEILPDARVEIVPGTGHLLHEEAPSRVEDLIREFEGSASTRPRAPKRIASTTP